MRIVIYVIHVETTYLNYLKIRHIMNYGNTQATDVINFPCGYHEKI